MNKSELLAKYEALKIEFANFEEILNGTEGSTYHYMEILDEIAVEMAEVRGELRAIRAAEMAAQSNRKAA